MSKIAALAVAVTVSGPSYSGAVTDREIERLAQRGSERQALTVLIGREWIEGEASERGIVVTGAPPGDARTERLAAAIRDQIAQPAARSVTPEQVRAHVDAHPQSTPETRSVRYVATKNRREALKVLERLRRGATWASVGAVRRTFARADDNRVARAVFRARLGRPSRYGRAVFSVIEHSPPRPLARAHQEALAWELLASHAQERALAAFLAQFTEKWRKRTSCVAEYADHGACGGPPTGQQTP